MKAGNEKSFDQLFRIFYVRLCAYAATMVNATDAENIVQDLFVHIWEQRKRMELHTSVSTYLYVSVRNRCMTFLQHEAIGRRVITSLTYSSEKTLDPDGKHELFNLVCSGLMTLSATTRKVFLLHRFSNMSYKEIADTLGLSVKNVDYRIGIAKKELRKHLKDFID